MLLDRLGQWLDWSHAVALSTALDGLPAEADASAPLFGETEVQECARVRRSLAKAIVNEQESASVWQREPAPILDPTDDASTIDFAAFHQRYLALQRTMLTATGKLRGRLRDMLTQAGPDMARLAAVDAAMERMLSPREQTLLANVPTLLGEHFERLRKPAPANHELWDDTPAISAMGWLDIFRKDMQSVLLAELDVRFQPVEGLLAALRTRQVGPHVQTSP